MLQKNLTNTCMNWPKTGRTLEDLKYTFNEEFPKILKILLLRIFTKILEKIIKLRLVNFADKILQFDKFQYGFQLKSSSIGAITGKAEIVTYKIDLQKEFLLI